VLVIGRLFTMCDKLMTHEPIVDGTEGEELVGFNGAPLWLWRCMGMLRECGRKHPKYVGELLGELRSGTQQACERHVALAKTFAVLEELAGSDILPQAH